MNIKFKTIGFLILSLIIVSCTDQDDKVILNKSVCDTANTEFQQIYNSLLVMPTSHDEITMDGSTHEYTFRLSVAKTLCSVGYQSAHTISTTPYAIEIVEVSTGAVLYSDNFVFSNVTTSYAALSSPLNLQANVDYKIRRIQSNLMGNLDNYLGRMIVSYDNNSFPNEVDVLPITRGDLTILNSSFPEGGMSGLKNYLPYIDLVFQN